MDKEQLRMQMLSGIITEGEYKVKLEENKLPKLNPPLNEGEFKDSLKKWVEASIAHIHKLDEKGRFSFSDLEYLKDIIEDAWFYVENGGKEEQKSLERLLGYKLPKLNPPLNENFVGIGMVGNIFERDKTDYEIAFEHFTKGKMNEEMDSNMGKEELVNKIKNLGDFGFTGDEIKFKGLLTKGA
jgi:hypothetical protein